MSKTLLKKIAARILLTTLLAFLLGLANLYWGTTFYDSHLESARTLYQTNPTDANRVALEQAQTGYDAVRRMFLLRWTVDAFVLVNVLWLVWDFSYWLVKRRDHSGRHQVPR